MINKKQSYSSDLIVQSNDLIEAIYDSDLSATEHKILRYAASQIKKNPDKFPRVSFGVKEFMNAAGLKGNNYHSQVIKIGDELSKKRIKIQNKEKLGWFPWLSSLVYDKGVVYLAFNTEIKNLILELEGQFTKYSYQYIGDMRSGYTIRLFELLKQYANIGKRRLELDTLKKMLGVADKYPGYGQFKARVLMQAKKEMDKKDGLRFEFEEIKQGRKVTELVFFIVMKNSNHNKQLDFFAGNEVDVDTFVKEAQFLLENYNLVIKEAQIRNWAKYGIETLNEVLEEVQDRKMDHPPAYITKVLNSKQSEVDEMKKISKNETDNTRLLIRKFIKETASKEVIPGWFMKNKFIDFMKGELSHTEIENVWETHGEYILNHCKK